MPKLTPYSFITNVKPSVTVNGLHSDITHTLLRHPVVFDGQRWQADGPERNLRTAETFNFPVNNGNGLANGTLNHPGDYWFSGYGCNKQMRVINGVVRSGIVNDSGVTLTFPSFTDQWITDPARGDIRMMKIQNPTNPSRYATLMRWHANDPRDAGGAVRCENSQSYNPGIQRHVQFQLMCNIYMRDQQGTGHDKACIMQVKQDNWILSPFIELIRSNNSLTLLLRHCQANPPTQGSTYIMDGLGTPQPTKRFAWGSETSIPVKTGQWMQLCIIAKTCDPMVSGTTGSFQMSYRFGQDAWTDRPVYIGPLGWNSSPLATNGANKENIARFGMYHYGADKDNKIDMSVPGRSTLYDGPFVYQDPSISMDDLKDAAARCAYGPWYA